MKLAIGTVQLGMTYGLRGRANPPQDDAVALLDCAVQNGIKTIDTAQAYGCAEQVVGEFLRKSSVPRQELTVISKVMPNILDDVLPEEYHTVLQKSLVQTLDRLHTDYVDGYLLHSARYIFSDAILDALARLKSGGMVKSVGVSVYEPEEAEAGIKSGKVDMMQLPYSVLDRRMSSVLAREDASTIIHSRSALLQGLLLLSTHEIPEYLRDAIPLVERFHDICRESGVAPVILALNYVKANANIDTLVFGARTVEQLSCDIKAFNADVDPSVISLVSDAFLNVDKAIVMPSLWKKT